jgi:hypothetical protein
VAEPQPRQRPTFEDITVEEPGHRYLSLTPRAVLAGLLALVMLVFGSAQLVGTVQLAHRGVVVNAEVVAARHGTKADFVTVYLPAPLNRSADLISWSGRPEPGDVLAVRYDPASPTTATQAGSWPWGRLLLLFGGAGFSVLLCWWYATRPWRRRRAGIVP